MLALLALEGGLRLVMGPPPPPVRVFGALKDYDQYLSEQGVYIVANYVQNNAPTIPLQSKTPRCAVLGGSSVHDGSPSVPTAAEFPALIGEAVGIPVVNLGAPGLDSFDMVRIVEDLVQWKWSCIVLYGPHNDFGNAFFQARFGTPLGAFGARALAFMERFQLFTQVARLVNATGGTRLKGNDHGAPSGLDDERFERILRYLEQNHRRMAWLAEQHGIETIIVSPVGHTLNQPGDPCTSPGCAWPIYKQAMNTADWNPQKAAQLFREARDADRIGLRAPTAATEALHQVAIDTGSVWVDAEKMVPQHQLVPLPSPLLFTDGVHFTAAGHRAMAEAIAPAVRQAVAGR
ncbi:MAG: hypothetical protein FJ102_26740 [Deltaproteobacteria bacterium]|nr:hypothetical protein [Deltaproteobacteria bacterium]